ncbi:MAG: bifunctional 4-hydroxy-2-oxoglutarate aldolase/2-dehydro-3-deoxy-phosphogluconate aldolase [Clostridia bacterium]|nr:bifunctional 4-hydroxy-2-oxoglutarate aldolase/2-dehydro-3-deoxy-phosphogluconate aldolase [Clostridia bacterium]
MIKKSKLIAIARGIGADDLIPASLALYEGGVRAFEVTFEQDKPIETTVNCISKLIGALPSDTAVGAGTVMDTEQVRAAYKAGASFIISPNTDKAVIEEAKELRLVSIPGAMTPTEISAAYSFGADIVKVFPAGILGAEYFKAVRAPLSHIPMAAVAAVTTENIRAFADAGAAAFGISSSLYIKDAIESKDMERIKNAAAEFYLALE